MQGVGREVFRAEKEKATLVIIFKSKISKSCGFNEYRWFGAQSRAQQTAALPFTPCPGLPAQLVPDKE